MGFYNESKYYLAVDCIIFGFDDEGLKLLLIKRNFEPKLGKWSLMGGFLKPNEHPDEAADRVLKDLTGLSDVYLEQLYTYGDVKRDDAGRVVSISYYALIDAKKYKSGENSYDAHWFRFEDVPELIFDHNQMVVKALKRLQRRCKNQPVGFELLPEKFSLPQLQKLYETIFLTELDKRNFRRKILDYGFLIKMDEKDKNSSKKGAFLYKFDKRKYDQLVEEGMSFEIRSLG